MDKVVLKFKYESIENGKEYNGVLLPITERHTERAAHLYLNIMINSAGFALLNRARFYTNKTSDMQKLNNIFHKLNVPKNEDGSFNLEKLVGMGVKVSFSPMINNYTGAEYWIINKIEPAQNEMSGRINWSIGQKIDLTDTNLILRKYGLENTNE